MCLCGVLLNTRRPSNYNVGVQNTIRMRAHRRNRFASNHVHVYVSHCEHHNHRIESLAHTVRPERHLDSYVTATDSHVDRPERGQATGTGTVDQQGR